MLSAVLGPLIPQLILFLLLDLLWFHVMMAPASTLLWWQTDATTHLEDGFDAANADPDAPNKLPQDYTNLLSRTLAFTMLMLGARVLEKFLKAHSIMLKKIIGIKIQTGIMSCLLFKQLEKSRYGGVGGILGEEEGSRSSLKKSLLVLLCSLCKRDRVEAGSNCFFQITGLSKPDSSHFYSPKNLPRTS